MLNCSNWVVGKLPAFNTGDRASNISRNLRKIEILLKEFERARKHVDYFALDLSLPELQRTFSEVSTEEYEHVGLHGLHGTYNDAITWLSIPDNRTRPTVVMSMGSSLGNFNRPEAAEFLGRFARLMTPSDMMIIGLDGCKNPEKVYRAYNDKDGVTHQFYENGLAHANEVLGYEAFKPSQWQIVTHFDPVKGQHQAFYSPTQDVTINGIILPKGEKLVFEEATKYGPEERDQLWRTAGLIPGAELGNSSDDYRELVPVYDMHLASSPRRISQFSTNPAAGWSLSAACLLQGCLRCHYVARTCRHGLIMYADPIFVV